MMSHTIEYKTEIDYKSHFERGITYGEYLENFQKEIELGDESPFAQYLPQNWQRQSRLDRKFKLGEELSTAVSSIKWILITEHWCGDASQILPIINKVAQESNGKIDLKLVYRDEDESLINAHLTDGRSKSIPILLVFDTAWTLKGTYGPRPKEAQTLVKSYLSKGESYNIPLHTWYAKDKQKGIQSDLTVLLKNQNSPKR